MVLSQNGCGCLLMQHNLIYADRYLDNQIDELWLMDHSACVLGIPATKFMNLIEVHIICQMEVFVVGTAHTTASQQGETFGQWP